MTISSQSIHVCRRMALTVALTVSPRVAGTQTEIDKPPTAWPLLRGEPAIDLLQLARHTVDGEVRRPEARRRAQSLEKRRVGECSVHRGAEEVRRAGRHQQAIHYIRQELVGP